MKNVKNNELSDRRAASEGAKVSLLNAYRAAKTAAEPAKMARHAERMAIVAAREERRVERERLKHDERVRAETQAAEQRATAESQALAETEAREGAEKARISRVIKDEAERKAERDRRYANRKARQA
ncbi:DUF6481 family protein [Neorhizobium sp. T786]|uniref:DUF6481 family protein n=1 Tax=Pseudorhizobium xiangyangii TaxID=2883104 RepID=UPI001CFFE462|nr:DUF6481 family protein [Neorhizobium xiangyangii]MCB5205239.1 DUF6481 family protein [Neorhizobium xiangyangii]